MKRVPRWAVLSGAVLCQLGLTGGTLVMAAFMAPVLDDLGWSRSDYAWHTLPLLIGLSVGSVLAGATTDRIGPGPALSLGITTVAAGYLLFSRVTETWQLYAVALVLGLGAAGVGDVPATAAVARRYRENRGLAVGIVNVGSNMGGAILPVVAELASRTAGWRDALIRIAVVGWVLLFPVTLAMNARPPLPSSSADARRSSPEAASGNAVTLRAAIRMPSFWILAGAVFAYLFYYFGVMFHFGAFLRDSGFSDAEAALGFGAAMGLGIFGKLGMGLFADRLSPRTGAITAYSLTVVGALLLVVLGSAPWLLPVILVVNGLVTAQQVVIPLLVVREFGVESFGRTYGAMMLALLPGGFGGTVFAARIFDFSGSYVPAFASFAAINLAATIGLAFLSRVSREDSHDRPVHR